MQKRKRKYSDPDRNITAQSNLRSDTFYRFAVLVDRRSRAYRVSLDTTLARNGAITPITTKPGNDNVLVEEPGLP